MSGRRKLVGNSFSMLVNRLTQGIVTFVLTANIARYLGAYALGQYLLAFSYYYMFMSIASQGLKVFFTRALAREPEEMPVYLVNGTLLQFLLSVIGYLALVIVVFLLPYSSDTSTVCYIMGLTIVPFALSNITEAVFQAQERMHLIALATVPVYILRLLIMIWAMNLKYGVGYLAGIMVISETLILVIEWILLIQTIKPKWQIKQDFLWDIINSARTLFAIEAIGIIASRMQILILSLLGSEVLVGIYGGIEQLMQPVYIVVNSILLAAFPRMSKAVDSGREDQRKLTEDMLGILLCIAIPFLMGMLFFGDELLSFAYKDPAFQQAILPLHLVTLTLVTFTFLRTLGYILLANGFENFNLIEVTVTTVLGGLSGVFFISQYKLLGAAYMALVMSFSAAGVLMYAVYSRLFSLRLWKIMHRPSLISLLMLPVFIILKEIGLNFIMTLITATFAYILLVSCLAVYLFGGPFAVWKKLLKKA